MAVESSVSEDPARAVARLGLPADAVLQVVGWDEDCDEEFLALVEGSVAEVVIDQASDVVDGVFIWWREQDSDLADGLLDARSMLADHGLIWLFTPRPGRPGHMSGSEVKEAVQVAGLRVTSSISVGADWQAVRLTTPKGGR